VSVFFVINWNEKKALPPSMKRRAIIAGQVK
jgi:hypothetical protein